MGFGWMQLQFGITQGKGTEQRPQSLSPEGHGQHQVSPRHWDLQESISLHQVGAKKTTNHPAGG